MRTHTRRGSVGLAVSVALLAALFAPATPAEGARGVKRRTVKIGIHAPLTGASPLPSRSVERGAEVYWRWLRVHDGRINGRNVEVVVMNDNYNPSQAVAVCKEMVEERNVFLLSGLINPGGKDQVQACARYADSVGVPYLSLGQMKRAVKKLDGYFATTATYARQSRLLADLFVDRLRARRKVNGIVYENTPNYSEAQRRFAGGMQRRNADLHYQRSLGCCAGATEAQTIVQEMKVAGVENAFVLTRPTFFLQLLQAAQSQNYSPRWTGIANGIAGSEAVLRVGCKNGDLQGAKFISPLPSFADRNRFDARFRRAMRRFYGDAGDDVTWLGWAGSLQIGNLLRKAGRKLTPRRFIRVAERTSVRTRVLPRARFRPRDHFGGKASYLLTARCDDSLWRTSRRAKRNF